MVSSVKRLVKQREDTAAFKETINVVTEARVM
jgi:hypothetical protein